MATKQGNGIDERFRILEKALANLGDAQRNREVRSDADISDILRELKALKVFLARTVPEFKEQFPGIQRKVK